MLDGPSLGRREYAIALFTVAASAALVVLLRPWIETVALVLPLFGVVLWSAWRGALGPALLTSGASAVVLLLSLPHQSAAEFRQGVIQTAIFLLAGVGVSYVGFLRYRADDHAAQEHQLLRLALATICDAVVAVSAEGEIILFNPIAEQLLGRFEAEVIGHPVKSVLALVDQHTRAPVEPGQPALLVTGGGAEIPVETSAAPLSDARGRNIGKVIVLRDIRTRLDQQRAVADSEQRYRLLFQNSPLPTWIYDTATLRFLAVNDAAVATYGYSREEFLSGTIADIRPPEDLPSLLSNVANAKPGRTTSCWRHRRKDGSLLTVEITSHPVSFGPASARMVLAIDVTQRVQAQQALQQSEALFRRVFEESAIGMVFLGPDYRYLRVNPAFSRLVGYTEEELLLRTFLDITHPQDRDSGMDDVARLFRGEISGFQHEKRYVTKTGNTVWARLNTSLLRDSTGRPAHHLVLIEDITERRESEIKRARYMQELARSNEALQQFASAISHDLQEPLRSVGGYTALVERRYLSQADDDTREYFDYIRDGVTRMQAMIRDLLRLSRVSDEQEHSSGPVVLDDVLSEALLNLQFAIEDSGAVVHADPLPTVHGQQALLSQLLQNLLSNAIKYRRPEAQPQIRVTAACHGQEWIVQVADNGQGIPPEARERVFGVFKRLHGREVPGTGIGLALCRKIVEIHGGRIWVEPVDGPGAVLRFSLPRAEE